MKKEIGGILEEVEKQNVGFGDYDQIVNIVIAGEDVVLKKMNLMKKKLSLYLLMSMIFLWNGLSQLWLN